MVTFDILIEATVVVNIKGKLSSSVASSVWDSRKLEIIVGFLRAVVLRRGPSLQQYDLLTFGPHLTAKILDVEASILYFRPLPCLGTFALCLLGLT